MYMLGIWPFTPPTHNDIVYGDLAVWPKATRQACKCTMLNPDLRSLNLNAPLSEWQKLNGTSALWDAQGFQLGGEVLLIQQRRRTGSEALRFLYFEIEGEKSGRNSPIRFTTIGSKASPYGRSQNQAKLAGVEAGT